MTTFQYFDGLLAFWPQQAMGGGNYNLQGVTATTLTYQGNGFLDPSYAPDKIVFGITGRTTMVDDASGAVIVTGGTITSVTFRNADGGLLMRATGLQADLAVADFYLSRESVDGPGAFWDYVLENVPGGALILGSNDTREHTLPYAVSIDMFERGDDLATTRGNDTVNAGGGDDFISDYGGSDVYNGGAGTLDILSYNAWRTVPRYIEQGIIADLAAGTVIGPDGKTDRISNIEALRGAQLGDVMRGDAQANWFIGKLGADTIDGRGGFDMVYHVMDDWSGGRTGVVVNLSTGLARDGYGTTDQLVSIEGAVGTVRADRCTDNGASNRFDGGGWQ